MAEAEGRNFEFEDESFIKKEFLEKIPYQGPHQFITYKTREFSAVCPYSGLPDYAELIIEYVPLETIVELKSLKYYITSYRNVGIYQEPATNRLFIDLWELMQPYYLKITTIYNTRGGIDATAVVEKGHVPKN